MLDLDLDLEADLGIDTVKQAELFASIREAYGIARDDEAQAARLPDLDHVIEFVRRARPRPPARPPAPTPTPVAPAAACRPTRRSLTLGRGPAPAARAGPRPAPAARRLRTDRRDARRRHRVVVVLDSGGVGQALAERLRAARRRGARRSTAPDADELSPTLDDWLRRRSDRTASTGCRLSTTRADRATMDLAGWREALRGPREARSYATMRAALRADRAAGHVPGRRAPGSAASTATTRRARLRRWAAPSPASPRPTSGSARTRW